MNELFREIFTAFTGWECKHASIVYLVKEEPDAPVVMLRKCEDCGAILEGRAVTVDQLSRLWEALGEK